jgi:transcriptional regulator with XRE-family HTH domain
MKREQLPATILANQIRAGMENRGLTQQALADALGGSPSQSRISAILRGRWNPQWSTVCRIAKALGVEIGTGKKS